MLTDTQIRRIEEWKNTSITIREPKYKAGLCRELAISLPTLNKYLNPPKKKKDKIDQAIDTLAGFTEDELMAFERRAYRRAMEDGASAKHMELFAKLQGMLVDKSEMKVKVSADADELARIDAEAERRASDYRKPNRTEDLSERPPILLGETREDTRQAAGGNPS